MFVKGFPQDRLITYSGMLWLLAAQIVVMLPLLFHLPVWLFPILFFSAGWRIRAMQGKVEQPGIIVKILLVIAGLAALKLSGISVVSLEMMASFLMLGFAYKSLEVIQRRDGMVVILTGYILVGVLFLYSQSILTALYSFVSVAALTGAMIAIQQTKSTAILPNLRLASMMLALCLPLMILFFLFAPRFQPFWTVPSAGGHAKTGVSDSMTPGDISNLSQSDGLAFSVKFLDERFKNKAPIQSQLYWRGLVYQFFDGSTWSQHDPDMRITASYKQLLRQENDEKRKIIPQGDAINYEVIYQKTGQTWMFAIPATAQIKGDAFHGPDYRVMAHDPIIEPTLVTFKSYPAALRDVELPEETRALNLQLPDNSNPKSRVLAEQLLSASASKEEYIQRVLNRYREQSYFYTLRPPVLSRQHSIDAFLFESKQGFCEHYSGSFVFMMRAAGIPARVVGGYQGGTWNEKGQFLTVRQFDAHAWTEVWLEGKGWQRFDPTAMVAPDRIERNLETAMQQEGSFLEDRFLSLSKVKWLNGLQQQLDSLQYGWRRFVLGYDGATQQNFLKNMFGEMSVRKTMLIVGGFFGVIIALWVGFLGLARKRHNEALEHQLYRRFCAIFEKKGLKREASQTPEAFSQLASLQFPDLAEQIKAFTQSYSSLCYNPDALAEKQLYLDEMRSLLKRF